MYRKYFKMFISKHILKLQLPVKTVIKMPAFEKLGKLNTYMESSLKTCLGCTWAEMPAAHPQV
jgi:hypothetical protein